MTVQEKYAAFEKDLEALVNRHSVENLSNTPDFQIAAFLVACLQALDRKSTRLNSSH